MLEQIENMYEGFSRYDSCKRSYRGRCGFSKPRPRWLIYKCALAVGRFQLRGTTCSPGVLRGPTCALPPWILSTAGRIAVARAGRLESGNIEERAAEEMTEVPVCKTATSGAESWRRRMQPLTRVGVPALQAVYGGVA
jgi:hypothetical protein